MFLIHLEINFHENHRHYHVFGCHFFGLFAILYFGAAPAALEESVTNDIQPNYTAKFLEWKKEHNKTYVGSEHEKRFAIFRENLIKIEAINSKNRAFTVGANKFADLNKAEFRTMYLGLDGKSTHALKKTKTELIVVANQSIDWRWHHRIPAGRVRVVTSVKDQGQCGAGWAFSAVGALEGFAMLQQTDHYRFSEQQIIDCSGNLNGCKSGHIDKALEYTSTKGIEDRFSYPYIGIQDVCKYDSEKIQFLNGGYDFANSDNDLQKALNEVPVAISVQADQDVFQFYTSGILDSDDCGTDVNHGALAVGYDVIGDKGFWIVKNSWGESWGEKGYIRIARASGAGICGINTKNVYASTFPYRD